MAKTTASSIVIAFILSLLLFSIAVESRSPIGGLVGPKKSLQCQKVFGVRLGDTCFDIAENFQLTTAEFNAFNPNLDCSLLFVGQWLCISASLV